MRILHLSDIHLGTQEEATKYRMQLQTDLRRELGVDQLDYLVISGDIANRSVQDEYDAAVALINGLAGRFSLPSDRIIVAPGNHDLNWDLAEDAYTFVSKRRLPDPLPEGEYILAGDIGALKRDQVRYRQRFAHFGDHFYHKVCGQDYPPEYAAQGILHFYPTNHLLFLTLNSSWQIDHHYTDRAGINMTALSHALGQLQDGDYDDWLKIAVWHHPVTGREMMNDEFLQLLAVQGFKVCLHGHIHEARQSLYTYDPRRNLHIIGAGTFGAPLREQAGIPLQYNLLIVDPAAHTITVETRKKEKPDGAWMADARWGDKNNPLPRYVIELEGEVISQSVPLPPHVQDLRQAEHKYLCGLFDRHCNLQLKGLGVSDRVPLRLPLLELYIPLQARVQLPEGEAWSEELRLAGREIKEDRLGGPRPVLDLLRENDGLIVLGDPGAGKTTFVKYLALKLASRQGADLGLELYLPVLVPLSAYANALAEKEVRLDDFIAGHLHTMGANLPMADLLREALREGRVLLLLDGLDEVRQERLRYIVVNQVENFYTFHRPAGNKFVLTSRVVGYREVRPDASGLAECTLIDLRDDEIEGFVGKWTLALERQALGDTATAVQEAERERRELLAAIQRSSSVRRLAANPLLLTILALMKRQGVTLPERRVELYDQYVRTLLSSWNRARGLGRPQAYDLDVVQTVRVLADLALWMHETNPGVGLVKQRALERRLVQIYTERGENDPERAARRFLSDVREYAGLLVERGAGQYGFIHLTFEEYLAGVGVARLGQRDIAPVVDVLCKHIGEAAWYEVSLLAVAYLGLVQQQEEVASDVVDALIKRQPGKPGQAVVLAGQAALDAWPGGVTTQCKALVEEALTPVMQSTEVSASLRCDAGLVLGRLGWRPDDLDAFVEIAPGPFLYGDRKNRCEIIHPYLIARYPVTNVQYARFVDAKGYEQREFWGADGWAWRSERKQDKPRYWYDLAWNNPIFPVSGVSWYEAEAYCNWLTHELQSVGCTLKVWKNGQIVEMVLGENVVRLPNEDEWERAARGVDGRVYPWGDTFDETQANTRENGVMSTTAVCTHPQGSNAAGLWDMAGNVWEWTGSLYQPNSVRRVVRGGSFVGGRDFARCAYRHWLGPVNGWNHLGLRVSVSPSLQPR